MRYWFIIVCFGIKLLQYKLCRTLWFHELILHSSSYIFLISHLVAMFASTWFDLSTISSCTILFAVCDILLLSCTFYAKLFWYTVMQLTYCYVFLPIPLLFVACFVLPCLFGCPSLWILVCTSTPIYFFMLTKLTVFFQFNLISVRF